MNLLRQTDEHLFSQALGWHIEYWAGLWARVKARYDKYASKSRQQELKPKRMTQQVTNGLTFATKSHLQRS
jgi:hypothetical protein